MKKARTLKPSANALSFAQSGYTNKKVEAQRLGTPDVQQTCQVDQLLSAEAIYQYRQFRWSPISSLTPESLTSQLQEWNVGTFQRFSITMDAVENRDLVVKAATGKLKMALSRRTYEIVKVEGADPDEADAHADALRHFYANCTATSAVDRNIRGGFSRLVHFMMDAALKKYAPFEIVWQPKGDMLTASFIHVPIWFFENRTGVLRFRGNFAWDGVPLKDGNWMVTCGEGIMESIVVGYLYKLLALRDWMIYSERSGMSMPVAHTAHSLGSPGYNALSETLQNIGPDRSIIMGLQDKIDKIEFGSAGQLPYPIMIEYFDKAIVALARGADLGTLSSGIGEEGNGASLQGDESDLVEQHYGGMVTESLNHYVDPFVLRWHFGDDVTPCAYVRLNVPQKKNIDLELKVDEALVSWGIELGVENTLERYGRVEAGPGDRILEDPMQRQMEQQAQFEQGGDPEANERMTPTQKNRLSKIFLNQSRRRLCHQVSANTRPVQQRLEKILALRNNDDFVKALRGLAQELPSLRIDDKTRKELRGSIIAMS